MNVTILISDLKPGNLYFKEVRRSNATSNYFIVKVKEVQFDTEKKQITISYSSLVNYSLFHEVFEFQKNIILSSMDYKFFKDYIQTKNLFEIYYFYNFDEKWFLKNKEKILSKLPKGFHTETLPTFFKKLK